jgi:glycosyltransferase involved in cell wall biosynthesis
MKKDLKVAILCEFPPPYGGMAVQAGLLVERLREEGLTVCPIETNLKFSYPFQWIGCIRGLRGVIQWLVFLCKAVLVIPRVDIIHILSSSYLNFYLFTVPAVILAKTLGKKIVLNYRGGEAEKFFKRSKRLVKRIIGKSDRIIVPSGFLKEVFEKFGFNVKIIPNVANVEKFPFKERRSFGPQFVISRHLEPLYNVGCAIRSFALVHKKYPGATLRVAGGGSEEGRLKNLTQELGLNGSVEFFGEVKNHDIIQLYDESDIFLNSSNEDNMPISILEAFANGLPVVSTAAGGIPHIVKDGHNGFLVGLNDHKAMAEKIEQLLENPTVASNLTKEARKSIGSYQWNNVKEQWLSEYQTLSGINNE